MALGFFFQFEFYFSVMKIVEKVKNELMNLRISERKI